MPGIVQKVERQIWMAAGLDYTADDMELAHKAAIAAIGALRLPANTDEPLTFESLWRKQKYHDMASNFNKVIDAILEAETGQSQFEEKETE